MTSAFLKAFAPGALLLCVLNAGSQAAPDSSAGSVGAGQLISRSVEERGREWNAARRLSLPVVVSGTGEGGLREADFTVFDEGRPQKITSFEEVRSSGAGGGRRFILLLDGINNTSNELSYERAELQRLLRDGTEAFDMPVALAALTKKQVVLSEASTDRRALEAALKRLNVSSSRGASLVNSGLMSVNGVTGSGIGVPLENQPASEAVGSREVREENARFVSTYPVLLDFIEQQAKQTGEVTVIWLGTGWPLLAGPGFGSPTTEMRANYYSHLAEISDALRAARMTMDEVASPALVQRDGIAREDASQWALWLRDGERVSLSGVAAQAEAYSSSLSLPALALQSGGQIVDGSSDLAEEIRSVLKSRAGCYVLSLESKVGLTEDEYHSIRVSVGAPGLSVLAPSGYYAQP